LQSGELRKSGMRLRLSGQPFEVLAVLVQRPGEVVTREELHSKLWPADTFVDFDHGLNNAVARIREVLDDSSDTPRYVETIPRRGYRFVAPVICNGATSNLEGQGLSSAPTVKVAAQKHRLRRTALAAGLAALFLLAIPVGLNLGGWRQRLFARSDAGRIPSIAVLPFKNLSSEPDSDYFSDGLTDEIIRNLSIIDGLQVKSGTSSFTFKDKPRNIHEVGAQLGANLVLEGSVLRSGNKLRINAQLVRVSDDVPLWSQRFDRDLKDVFAIQDEISRAIVNNLRLK